MLSSNLTVGANGRLYFGGQDTVAMAEQYGTPLYLMDEIRIRENMRMYQEAFRTHFGPGSCPLYASKAASFKRLYEIAKEEDMGIENLRKAKESWYPLYLLEKFVAVENTGLCSGNTEPLSDADFKNRLTAEYKKAVYEYQKRLTVICDLCLESPSAHRRFCGSFTSFENLACIAELISVSFGVLRRLQKTSDDRRQIAKIRSCAVKLKTTLEHMQEMITEANEIEKL